GRMAGQLDEATKLRRREELMLAQQDVAFALAERRVGTRFEVLVDKPRDGKRQEARHAGQAPEVDSVTWLEGAEQVPGTFVEVRCVRRQDYDLVAVPATVKLPVLA